MKKIVLAIAAGVLLASCGNSATQNPAQTGATVIEDKATVGRTTDGAVTYGEGAARVQVFSDFQCPACQSSNQTVAPVLDELAEAGKITIEYRQFPLTQIHKNAYADANAALCAADQNAFRSYHQALYALEVSKRGATVSDAERIAAANSLGMDMEKFSSCVNNQENKAKVDADMTLGNSLGISGTPTYLLDGQSLSLGAFTPADNSTVTFQKNLRKFLETYVARTSGQSEPVVTSDENASTGDNGVGGVVSTPATH
ncbi:thioredoxin domain-containing protein [Candidatus Gracilibacteria bacterium]|nr:thioredoxin domain-containing protein [Candidatus Gracilibacteria bacterium]